jgi:hypothetical protein
MGSMVVLHLDREGAILGRWEIIVRFRPMLLLMLPSPPPLRSPRSMMKEKERQHGKSDPCRSIFFKKKVAIIPPFL